MYSSQEELLCLIVINLLTVKVKSLPVENRLEWIFSSADAHLPNLFMLVS